MDINSEISAFGHLPAGRDARPRAFQADELVLEGVGLM